MTLELNCCKCIQQFEINKINKNNNEIEKLNIHYTYSVNCNHCKFKNIICPICYRTFKL